MKGKEAYIAYGYTPSLPPPSWSSDAKLIAVGLDGYFYEDNNSRVVIVNSSGGLVREIAVRAWRIGKTLWSPDNRLIAFVTEEHSSRQVDQSLDKKVHIADVDGKVIVEFDHSEEISWSPDGRYLAFTETDNRMGYSHKVWLLDPRNKNLIRVLSSQGKIEKTNWIDKNRLVLSVNVKHTKPTASVQHWIVSVNR
jgi:Tol biopolymer transport system component